MSEVKVLYSLLQEMYPIKDLPSISHIKTLEDIIALKLSHFTVLKAFDFTRCVDTSEISHVRTKTGWMTKKEYISKLLPLIDHVYFAHFLYAPTYIPYTSYPHLEIYSVCLNNTIVKPSYQRANIERPLTYSSNHFIFFPSLDLSRDSKAIKKELQRLELTRDSHKTLHFHLYEGGDLSVVHAIILCLCGKKESWMTPYIKYDTGGSVYEDNITGKKTVLPVRYNPWNSEEDYPVLPTYKAYSKKYSGDIIVHVNFKCLSAAWYLLTYLIYAFATKITRSTRSIHGFPVKVGSVRGIIIYGHALTSGSDGYGDDPKKKIRLFNKPYTVKLPSIVDSTSIKENDYLRFWLPNTEC